MWSTRLTIGSPADFVACEGEHLTNRNGAPRLPVGSGKQCVAPPRAPEPANLCGGRPVARAVCSMAVVVIALVSISCSDSSDDSAQRSEKPREEPRAAVGNSAQPKQESPSQRPIKTGDNVRVVSARAQVKRGKETLTTVREGAEFAALKVDGSWVKVRITSDDPEEDEEPVVGWIHERHLARAEAAKGTAVRDKSKPKPEAPADEQIERTSVNNVCKLLRDLGFEVRDSHDMTINTNMGSWTFTKYFYVNKKTAAELVLYRNAGLFGMQGSRWGLLASDQKAREALLALAAQISPELRKACDECLAAHAQGKKPGKEPVGKKPKQLNVVVGEDSLIIETEPPPTLIYG